jgi:hypothetical protein
MSFKKGVACAVCVLLVIAWFVHEVVDAIAPLMRAKG